MKIALAGNPNSGKTTMYNALTGRSEKVGNWAGVTVQKKEAPLKKAYRNGEEEIIIADLPGAYSISPYTSEESITEEFIRNERPDAIINIVDGTNLSRSLFFTSQLLDMGIPVVVALNKSDVNEKKENKVDVALLEKKLGCPVIKTVSTTGEGLREVAFVAVKAKPVKKFSPENENISDEKRFEIVKKIVEDVETRKILTKDRDISDRIDTVLTGKVTGILVFAAVMFLVFYISQTTVGPWVADYLVGWIEKLQEVVANALGDANPLISAILADGIIGGVGAVIGFLPLVMVMYFLLSLLEDCGYMARVSTVLDPIFKKVGLSGKSVIPFVIGTGCAIPGIMACRTIKSERERRATAMLTPFMPCGAKLPVIALFSGVFFGDASWVGPMMYFVGIILIWTGAWLVNKIAGRAGKSFFIMEMPEYKVPSLKRACISMLQRAKAYIIKAGTIILLCNMVVQIMQSFTTSFEPVQEGGESTSILAAIAGPISVLLIPLGFGVWQMAAAAVTGFIAKENVVGTLAVCYGVTNFIDADKLALMGGADEVAAVFGITKAAALACLMFNLYTPPCFAAIGAMHSEIKEGKWLLGGICLQLGVGYSLAYMVYQIGTVITAGHVGEGFLQGLVAVAVMVAIAVYMVRRNKND